MDDEPLRERQRIWINNDMWRSLVNVFRRLVGLAPIPRRDAYPTDEQTQ